MLRSGRPEVPTFAPDESLYYRCNKAEVNGDALLHSAIHIPCSSVNRGGGDFGPPDDVTVDYPGFGVARLFAGNMPAPVAVEGRKFDFRVAHVPMDDNYAHSEIRAYRDGKYNKNWRYKPAQVVTLQVSLSKKARVIVAPTV